MQGKAGSHVLPQAEDIDKAMTVAKLKGARDRKSAVAGRRIEGRKPNALVATEAVKMAKRLYRRNPKTGGRRSLREIAAELAAAWAPERAREAVPPAERSRHGG